MTRKKRIALLSAAALLGAFSIGAIAVASGGNAVGILTETNEDAVIWKHYAAVEATFTSYGSKEFWASCSDPGTHVFTEPTKGTIQEGGDFSKTSYFSELTEEDDRYVAPLTPKVTFDSNGGTEVPSQNVKYGEKPSTPEAPTKAATAQYTYTFLGWALQGKEDVLTELPIITGDTTFVAIYKETLRSYTVKFVNRGEQVGEDQTVDYGKTPTMPTISVTQYEENNDTYSFKGWSKTEGGEVVTDFSIEGETTYYAKYDSLGVSHVGTYHAVGANEDGTYHVGHYECENCHKAWDADPTKVSDATLLSEDVTTDTSKINYTAETALAKLKTDYSSYTTQTEGYLFSRLQVSLMRIAGVKNVVAAYKPNTAGWMYVRHCSDEGEKSADYDLTNVKYCSQTNGSVLTYKVGNYLSDSEVTRFTWSGQDGLTSVECFNINYVTSDDAAEVAKATFYAKMNGRVYSGVYSDSDESKITGPEASGSYLMNQYDYESLKAAGSSKFTCKVTLNEGATAAIFHNVAYYENNSWSSTGGWDFGNPTISDSGTEWTFDLTTLKTNHPDATEFMINLRFFNGGNNQATQATFTDFVIE